jgi:cobalt-zinc-cadmium resistance protein CzcA
MGGQAATQVIQGERQFDLVVRMQEQFRSDENAIKNLLIATPDGQYLPLSQFCDMRVESGASFIYRESNSRYIGVQFSVEGRDLASAVGEARARWMRRSSFPSATSSIGAANTRSTWRRRSR